MKSKKSNNILQVRDKGFTDYDTAIKKRKN